MSTSRFRKIDRCRICGNSELTPILSLGKQALTGVFPKTRETPITIGPLTLVKCSGGADVCGLLQLAHSYDSNEMYGENYGYRSGLNPSMVRHLQRKVERILGMAELQQGDLVVDIGSNDGTTLNSFPKGKGTLVGFDPTGLKFREYYDRDVLLVPDFFSKDALKAQFGSKRAKIVTSFAMFYDLDNPLAFVEGIRDVLADDGIWVFEQSYMPAMLETNSFDTVCHEHLEYYGLKQIAWMADRAGLVIKDVEFNNVNGGSFSVTVGKRRRRDDNHSDQLPELLRREAQYDDLAPFREFAARTERARTELRDFVAKAWKGGKAVRGLGASTKGNVLLQYCEFTSDDIECIGEVNSEKFGRFTPGTHIPIVPEDTLFGPESSCVVVLPWHFREFFLASPRFAPLNLVFPLPRLESVAAR